MTHQNNFYSVASSEKSLRQRQAYLKHHLAEWSATPAFEARVLLSHILDRPLSWILAHPEYELSDLEIHKLSAAVAQLEAGKPLPVVIGHWEFFGLEFNISPHVLIPRPETERLVELALDWLAARPDRRSLVDVGTGSGCIAVTLAKLVPDLNVFATDLSWMALQTAQENAQYHKVNDRVHFVQGDLLNAVTGPFDVICANMPYIPTTTLAQLEIFGREPTLALDGGPDGLTLTHKLIAQTPALLASTSLLLMEIEANQGEAMHAIADRFFPWSWSRITQDLAGRDRLLVVENSKEPTKIPD
jgi:release factor glutamine methyltransferase